MLGLVAVLVLAAALITGCGGSSGGSSGSSEDTSAAASGEVSGGAPGGPGGFEISDEVRACLKEKGVELPEPGAGGAPPEGFEGGEPPQGGEPPAGFEGGEMNAKAFEECGVEMPQGKPGGPNVDSAAFQKQIKEYAACVRENGYDLPEPNLSGEGPVFSESEVDQSDPKFKEASEACQDKLTPQGNSG